MLIRLACIFSVVALSVLPSLAEAEVNAPPEAVDGVLDLRDWDFDAMGTVPLAGEWDFWWQELVEPERILSAPESPSAEVTFDVPNLWNKVEHPSGSGPYAANGFGTFLLRIKLPPGQSDTLGLYIHSADLAYELYGMRGEAPLPSMSNGVVGIDKDSEIPRYLPKLITIPESASDEITLVWHLSSHRHIRGGPRNAPIIGLERDLSDSLMSKRLRDMGLIGVLLIMGLYHFAIFTLRRKDRAPLWFGCLCVVMALRQIFTSSFVELFDSAPSTAEFEWLLKFEYLSIYFATAVFLSFIVHFVYAQWFDSFHKIVWVCSGAYALLTLATTSSVYPNFLSGYHLVILVSILVTIAHLAKVALQGGTAARVALVGFVIVALTAVNDVLKTQGVLNTPYIAVYGLGIFIFAKSYILARRFSVALDTSERLTEHLQEEVDARTHDLAVRNKSFKDILSTIELALFTVKRDGTINPEYSLMTEHLYARGSVAGMNFLDLMLTPDSADREAWEAWLRGAFEPVADWNAYLEGAPARLVKYSVVGNDGKTLSKSFELDFQQISPPDSDSVVSLMVITTDITEKSQLQEAVELREKEIEESIAQVTKILDEDPELFEIFLEEAEELVGNLEVVILGLRSVSGDATDKFDQIGRDLHTLKGTSAFYNQTNLAERVHVTEEFLKVARESGTSVNEEHIDTLLSHLDAVRGHLTRAQDVYAKIMKERNNSSEENPEVQKGPTYIKVNVAHLDELQSLTSRLVASQSTTDEGGAAVSNEVEACWTRLRKIPAQKLFDRFPRMVRDLSRHLDKEVRFECEGGDLAIDRNLFSALEDVLVHMIRNAVDHGIDSKEERRDASKVAEGVIQLRMLKTDAGVNVELQDDGRGIDPDFLRRRAMDKGLIDETEANALTDSEAMHLLFRPGFSTAAAVTDISGRGVGMDAVKSMVHEQSGTIQIESKKGQGTLFRLIFTEA